MASFDGHRLVVQSSTSAEPGDSIAVDGVCLTVVENDGGRLAFDVVPETLDRVKPFGERVNLEPAVRAGEPLGGHHVQGHVDGVGTVERVEPYTGRARSSHARARPVPRREKGSVAVDGVSLTVARLTEDGFQVALVPHTLAATTLSRLDLGDTVNLEVDVLMKYVERLLAAGVGPRGDDGRPPYREPVRDRRGGDRGDPCRALRRRRRRRYDRENEGDLTIAAQFATPEAVNFMVTHARPRLPSP